MSTVCEVRTDAGAVSIWAGALRQYLETATAAAGGEHRQTDTIEEITMKYMLLLTHDPSVDTGADDADEMPDMQPWMDYSDALRDAGAFVGGDPLAATDTATTVRVRDGERLLTDGPFATTKEHLIGYYVIDVDDLESALDWAARVPNVTWGAVEVRAIPDMTH